MNERTTTIDEKTIRVLQGDITKQDTEAIVNAANSWLLGGGGVDGAIHQAAGPKLMEECRIIKESVLKDHQGLLPVGQAVITKGYDLVATYVIHTVGPIYRKVNNPDELLRNAYSNSLHLAEDKGIHSIAFPSIGTGAYGCPIEWAANIALSTMKDFLHHSVSVQEVQMVLFSPNDYEIYKRTLQGIVG